MAYGAIDAIGGAMSPKVVKSLRKSGKYILYGALDTSPVSASNADLLALTKVLTSLCCMSLSPVVGCCATLNIRHRILLYTLNEATYLAVHSILGTASCCTCFAMTLMYTPMGLMYSSDLYLHSHTYIRVLSWVAFLVREVDNTLQCSCTA